MTSQSDTGMEQEREDRRGRVLIDCECGVTSAGRSETHAEVNHLFHYRRHHDLTKEERTEANNQLAARGVDP